MATAMQRREFLAGAAAVALTRGSRAEAARPTNLLVLMTDQQRFDALSCAGNPHLRTPHLDRLATEGVHFARAYCYCPVCVPARTVLLTGQTVETLGVLSNTDEENTTGPNCPTFDSLLAQAGYRTEYHGKYHSPYRFALSYDPPVRWLNGKKRPPGCRAEMSEAEAFARFLDATVPRRELQPGEFWANSYDRPYRPDPPDGRVGRTPAEVAALSADRAASNRLRLGQADCYGCLDVPLECTRTAFTASEGLAALDRLWEGPFSLTISFGPPHPPMVVPEPYHSRYPVADLPLPLSLNDSRAGSPYATVRTDPAYREPDAIRHMMANYYGLVTEVDDWVGRILARLDELGLAERTLVLFTSDHGENLGEHGLHGKGNFYEGAVRVPLLLRLPGRIPAGLTVTTPVSHIDLFATILDYLGQASPPSPGRSLRELIDNRGASAPVIAEWAGDRVPGYMVCDGRWKLMLGRTDRARSVDGLYDLENDPHELRNLLSEPIEPVARSEFERLRAPLLDWLEKTGSTNRASVARRELRPPAAA